MNAVSSLWDFMAGDIFVTFEDRITCEVEIPTKDGIGLVARYLGGTQSGEKDFIFAHEISGLAD